MATISKKSPTPILIQNTLIELGQRVTILRKARGYTQADLAQVASVGISTVAAIEGGFDGVAFGNVLKVMLAMGLLDQAEQLFSLENDPDLLRYAQSTLSKKARHG